MIRRHEEQQRDGDEDLPPAPQVVFFASGEAIPGLMTWVDIASGEVLWELEWDLLGNFRALRAGLAEDEFL